MRDPRFRESGAWADLDAKVRLHLETSGVEARLAVLKEDLTALSQQRSCTVTLGGGTTTMGLGQVRILTRCFLNDPSPRVRGYLAQRLKDLEARERFPLLAQLLGDPDESVRQAAELNLQAEPVLAYLRRGSRPEPSRPPFAVTSAPPKIHIDLPGLSTYVAVKGPESPMAIDFGAPGAEPELPETVVRRFTECDFTGNDRWPATGRVTFALRVQPSGAGSKPVDLRIPAGKDAARVLVHAFSSQFKVGPEVWAVKVPRAADSDVAEFDVEADKPGEGEVGLLVYDEYRLIGSLVLKLRAVDTPQGLTLEKIGSAVFRDPAPAAPRPSNGITVEVSLTGEGRAAFHLLLPLEDQKEWQISRFPLGRSKGTLTAEELQAALASLRDTVDEIQQGLGNPERLGAASAGEALDLIRLNLEGAGKQITEEVLSPVVREVLASLRPGSVVHWVIRDSALDAVPWELAWSPATGRSFNQDLVLVRVPVRGDPDQSGGVSALPAVPALPPAPDRLLYVLGANVADDPAQFPAVRKVVRSVGDYEVVTNFDGGDRQPLSVLKLRDQARTAKLIHLLCHGVVEKDKGLFLEIEENVLGRLTPLQVRGFQLPPNAVVFVNACSSAAATFSVAGLKTFGWSFLSAGARAYVGALAPVTTTLALRFAQAFFEGHLTRKLPLTQAMFEARQQLSDEIDPTWLLYTLYGDLSEAPQLTE